MRRGDFVSALGKCIAAAPFLGTLPRLAPTPAVNDVTLLFNSVWIVEDGFDAAGPTFESLVVA